jgi:hypothetical protein
MANIGNPVAVPFELPRSVPQTPDTQREPGIVVDPTPVPERTPVVEPATVPEGVPA